MTLKTAFEKYCKTHDILNKAIKEIDCFFSDLDLDYTVTYCAGDGVMILDCQDSLCGYISDDQLNRLSKSKTRDQALSVLKEINYDR